MLSHKLLRLWPSDGGAPVLHVLAGWPAVGYMWATSCFSFLHARCMRERCVWRATPHPHPPPPMLQLPEQPPAELQGRQGSCGAGYEACDFWQAAAVQLPYPALCQDLCTARQAGRQAGTGCKHPSGGGRARTQEMLLGASAGRCCAGTAGCHVRQLQLSNKCKHMHVPRTAGSMRIGWPSLSWNRVLSSSRGCVAHAHITGAAREGWTTGCAVVTLAKCWYSITQPPDPFSCCW